MEGLLEFVRSEAEVLSNYFRTLLSMNMLGNMDDAKELCITSKKVHNYVGTELSLYSYMHVQTFLHILVHNLRLLLLTLFMLVSISWKILISRCDMNIPHDCT